MVFPAIRRSFPTVRQTFLAANCTFTAVTGSPALSFQYTGDVSCLTFLPAAPPPVHLWVSCRVISWCHRSLTFRTLSSTSPSGWAVACGDVSPPPPAAALTGIPSPNSCPSSVATTSSLPSLPPPPAPWWLSSLIPVVPAVRRSWIADFPTKPLHPTSTGWMVAVHPPSLHFATRSEYLSCLNSCAACIPSSHGTVSSIMKAFLAAVGHTTASGLNVVWVISVGKISWVPRSTRISHPLPGVSRHVVLPATVFCPPSPGLRNGTFGWRVTEELFARTLHLSNCSAN